MRKKVKITDKYSQFINNGSAAEAGNISHYPKMEIIAHTVMSYEISRLGQYDHVSCRENCIC